MTPTIRAAILSAALAAVPATAYSISPQRPMHVAVLGDSLAHGAGDEEGKGIAGRLEGELRSRGIDSVITTKLGATGATTRDFNAALSQPVHRESIARADAIVLSIGANDLRVALLGGRSSESPLDIVDQVLRDIGATVAELHLINPHARILLLGAYIPLPNQRAARFLEPLIAVWDMALMGQFADDPLVTVVRLSDIIDRPERLSSIDSFHPGAEAYQKTARRIAELLAADPS